MMIDTQNVFSDKQALVSSGAASSNVIDCGQALNTTGLSASDLCVVVLPTEDIAGAGTVTYYLQESDEKGSGYRNVVTVGPMNIADIKPLFIRMPLEHKRYLRMSYVASGALSAGKVFSAMTTSIQAQQFYKAQDYSFQ